MSYAIDREADARLDRANPYGRDFRLDLRKRGGSAATPEKSIVRQRFDTLIAEAHR